MNLQEAGHERACLLAAESVDAELEAADATWLDNHLEVCPDCAVIAAEYRAIHTELRTLAAPEPPRDLWARTSAAMDRADAQGSGRSRGRAGKTQPSRRPMIWTGAAVGVVVVVAAASLLSQSPITHPLVVPGSSLAVALATGSSGSSSVAAAPLANVQGVSYWISSDADHYDIKSGTASCDASDGSCTVPSGTGQTIGSVTSNTPVSAVIAPDANRAAVWTADKVVILPLATAPATVSIDQITPRPTIAATATTAATAATIPPTAGPADTSMPSPTVAATLAITSSPATPATTQPTAILSGYEIVGRDPEFSVDGTTLAFSARPIDHSTGPDLFVWRIGQEQAIAVTSRHSDMFSGWYGRKILISEILSASADAGGQSAPAYTSFVFDPETGGVDKIDRPMLLPTSDSTSHYLVYWVGSVEFDQASGLWQPGSGDLYFDAWSDITLTPATLEPQGGPSTLPSGTPEPLPTSAATASTQAPAESPAPAMTAAEVTPEPTSATASAAPAAPTPPQLLPIETTPGAIHSWVVRWDEAGQHVAIWAADAKSTKIGRLDLFSVNPMTGVVDINEPLLAVDKVLPSIFFDDAGHLVYTSAVDGKVYMQAVPAVPPSVASTPAATAPGQQASSADASAGAQASTRPGN
ncbi:MAG TPA: zf-HC2 domain-containing protein [Candidatus Limnocylindrales bacterium]